MSRSVLAIGAHPDDIELGCAGTLLRHAAVGDTVTMLVMTKGEIGPGEVRDREHEQCRAAQILGAKIIWGDLHDCRISLYELEAVHTVERAIDATRPDVIYTHTPNDSHQDHRAVALATMGAARKCSTILTYDAPSSLAFRPTVYVDVIATIEKKIEALLCHASQVKASEMVDAERVRAQATYRGHEVRLLAAEAFEPIRAVWEI